MDRKVDGQVFGCGPERGGRSFQNSSKKGHFKFNAYPNTLGYLDNIFGFHAKYSAISKMLPKKKQKPCFAPFTTRLLRP
jgi:hypothetical protein